MLKTYYDFLDYHVLVHKMHQDCWYHDDQHDSYRSSQWSIVIIIIIIKNIRINRFIIIIIIMCLRCIMITCSKHIMIFWGIMIIYSRYIRKIIIITIIIMIHDHQIHYDYHNLAHNDHHDY